MPQPTISLPAASGGDGAPIAGQDSGTPRRAPGRRHSVTACPRGRSRLAGTMLLATTAAAVVAGSVAAGSFGLGRTAQREAVAAVMAVIALELMAVPAAPAAEIGGPPTEVESTASFHVPGRPALGSPDRHRLGPHRLNLPPPLA